MAPGAEAEAEAEEEAATGLARKEEDPRAEEEEPNGRRGRGSWERRLGTRPPGRGKCSPMERRRARKRIGDSGGLRGGKEEQGWGGVLPCFANVASNSDIVLANRHQSANYVKQGDVYNIVVDNKGVLGRREG